MAVVLCLVLWSAVAFAQTNDEIWAHFASWVRNSPPTQVRERPVMDLYAERLATEGVAPAEVQRRVKTIAGELRLKSRDNNIVYWDAMFRFGGGPDRPLRLLDEVARNLPPGRALDVAMGNGRNSQYLASLGWKVTGYDISPEGIALARKRATTLELKYEIVQAGHREFEFGVGRWDLIVLSYIVADAGDLESVFGRKLWDSLQPGGRIVCEGNFCELLVQLLLPLKLKDLRLERYSDIDDVRDGWATDNAKGRVIRGVIYKHP
jgi:2-polyprenyl-3-methyl-5-hydroxy-6-metoxy-1,4-benzoquinol methylase